jgi:hypothetical protein
MKKVRLALALVTSLFACTKEGPTDMGRPGQAPVHFFSRVRYFGDGRTPATDTVWTIKILNDSMYAVFERQHGYVFADQSPAWMEIGRLWKKTF